jgi:uncharacterized protein (DUF58 family)
MREHARDPIDAAMTIEAFHYKVAGRAAGRRPGAHESRSNGAGNAFMAHARLFDHPDPRRLDLRASLRAGGGEWLVRTYRQRAAVAVYAVVDVSASMAYGTPPKLDIAAAFVESMGNSAFKTGDSAGLCAFDGAARDDLFRPAQHSRMIGPTLAGLLLQVMPGAPRAQAPGGGLKAALLALTGRQALVFILSDFHWPLEHTAEALDLLPNAWVVPVVIWDPSETTLPPSNAFMRLRDAETGKLRPIWLTPRLRRQWQERIALRRAELDALFATRDLRPLYVSGKFDAQAVSQYFIEGEAG